MTVNAVRLQKLCDNQPRCRMSNNSTETHNWLRSWHTKIHMNGRFQISWLILQHLLEKWTARNVRRGRYEYQKCVKTCGRSGAALASYMKLRALPLPLAGEKVARFGLTKYLSLLLALPATSFGRGALHSTRRCRPYTYTTGTDAVCPTWTGDPERQST